MTRLRSLLIGGAAAVVMTGVVSNAFANESGTFTNTLAGASIGIPGGAAPPPGLYTGLETVWPLATPAYGNAGASAVSPTASTVKIGATIGIVPLVWATGWNFLGAHVTLNAIQAFYTAYAQPNATTNSAVAGGAFGAGPGVVAVLPNVANTSWGGSLSWNLGQGWFFSIGVGVEAPDGSSYTGSPNPDFWSVNPNWALSYLANNWVLSANMAYFINGPSRGNAANLGGLGIAGANGYTDGNEFYLDATAVYKIGKWEIGPVGYFFDQTTGDSFGAGNSCAAMVATALHCGWAHGAALGGLVGYDFGPVDLQVWVTDQFWNQDTPGGGITVWTRMGFRLWAPEAPKPLVAKN